MAVCQGAVVVVDDVVVAAAAVVVVVIVVVDEASICLFVCLFVCFRLKQLSLSHGKRACVWKKRILQYANSDKSKSVDNFQEKKEYFRNGDRPNSGIIQFRTLSLIVL